LDNRLRAQMLDESLTVLDAAWSGAPVHHRGAHYVIDGIRFRPRPVQRPRIPVWVTGFPGKVRPLRRAAEHDGYFPVNVEHADQLAEAAAEIAQVRGETGQDPAAPYDIAASLPAGADLAPYAAAGATWWMAEFPWDTVTVDAVRGVLRDGPAPFEPDTSFPQLS
jgi:alkanesulfonate monooxygenase SsuD/methylene tetrahydromethanopterin reductase-like flavin-dependent oxidoreductase (luciferase family)